MYLKKQPPEMLFKVGAVKNFATFTRKHLIPVLESPFLKVTGIQVTTLLKRDSNTGVFL